MSDSTHELQSPRPWYAELTRYHWFVLIVCTLGWLFDCGDQQLFALARKPAMAGIAGRVAQRSDRGSVHRLRDLDHADRLGDRRDPVRDHGRPHRPGEDDGLDDPVLFGVHRPGRAVAGALGLHVLPFHDGPGRGGTIRRGRFAGGRSDARPRATARPGHAPGILRAGKRLGGIGRHGTEPSCPDRRASAQRVAMDVRRGHPARPAGHRRHHAAPRAREVAEVRRRG